MLGFIFMYFIGKQFYDLALEHKKNGWLYAVLGVASYYAGTFLVGIFIGLGCLFMNIDIESINDLVLNLAAIPAGLLLCWLTFYLLKRNIIKSSNDANILDDGF